MEFVTETSQKELEHYLTLTHFSFSMLNNGLIPCKNLCRPLEQATYDIDYFGSHRIAEFPHL